MTELSLLAEQVGASERTLRRAVNEGTLRGKRLSPRQLKLSAAEKDYVLRRWGLLAQLRLALRTEPNVRFALLFGSAARGEDSEGSDIDLLVEMRDSSLARLADLELKLERLLGRRVEVIALDDAQENPLLLAEAARPRRDRPALDHVLSSSRPSRARPAARRTTTSRRSNAPSRH